MKGAEKEAVMASFAAGEADILVATTVIEVGVDVPNATLMVIENADRFGLSQLHQLRGRVGRGSAKAWCVLVSDNKNPETRQRLRTLCGTNDGFRIAEADLQQRGPGDFFGSRQHGLPVFRVENKITNKALLGILEDIGGVHSNIAGYGIPTMDKTHLTWILLDWKVQVIRRPNYAEKILARTWSKEGLKYYAYRDFEVVDEQGNVIVKAISRWVLVNIETGKMERITDEILSKYQPESNKCVFEDETFDKIKELDNYERESKYTVKRGDIDVNHHMHNINYLDLANEALPDEVYDNEKEFNNFKISYKKEIKLGETVKCKYSFVNNTHVICVKSEDDTKLHSVIEFLES